MCLFLDLELPSARKQTERSCLLIDSLPFSLCFAATVLHRFLIFLASSWAYLLVQVQPLFSLTSAQICGLTSRPGCETV